jgi:hypothetical protein
VIEENKLKMGKKKNSWGLEWKKMPGMGKTMRQWGR